MPPFAPSLSKGVNATLAWKWASTSPARTEFPLKIQHTPFALSLSKGLS